jgi:hypothetical protein
MLSNAYRLKIPLIAVVDEERAHLMELPEGAVVYNISADADSEGMVKGICRGHAVAIFACDLEERADPVEKAN